MKKENVVKRVGKSIVLTAALVSALVTSSCRKDAGVDPDSSSNIARSTDQLSAPVAFNVAHDTSINRAVTAHMLYVTFKNLKLTKPIYLKGASNIVIKGDSIVGGTAPCIYLVNCTNVRITHCKLVNSTDFGVYLNNSSNVSVDSCYISNVRAGVYAEDCHNGGIRVNYNQMKNMLGPYPHADCVQFDRVYGANNRVEYNMLENIQGQSAPEDAINLYMSTGLATDPILVEYNCIRGGGPSTTGSGITVGDNGGSYENVGYNILVNTGNVGIQTAGGNHINIFSNMIYSQSFPWSGGGLISANFSGTPATNNSISSNSINFIAGHYGGYRRDTAYKAGSGVNANAMPSGWKTTNTVNAPINAGILPTVIITAK